MAIVRIPISKFVAYMAWCLENKCGYIMGAYGQDPRKWSKDSWWFTQYTGEQRKKALYWREHAPLVMDCNGLAEGGYQKETGVNINARARNNYSSWCSPKVTGGSVYLRTLPSTSGAIRAVVHLGDLLEGAGDAVNGWFPVVRDGEVCYISGRYAENG